MQKSFIFNIVGDITISALAGFGIYFLCEFLNIRDFLMAMLIGTGAHILTRVVMVFDNKYGIKMDDILNIKRREKC